MDILAPAKPVRPAWALLRRPYKPGVKAWWRLITDDHDFQSASLRISCVFCKVSHSLLLVFHSFSGFKNDFSWWFIHCGMIQSEFFLSRDYQCSRFQLGWRFFLNLNSDLFVLFRTMLHYKAFALLWQRWPNFAREQKRKTWNALKGNRIFLLKHDSTARRVGFGGCVCDPNILTEKMSSMILQWKGCCPASSWVELTEWWIWISRIREICI